MATRTRVPTDFEVRKAAERHMTVVRSKHGRLWAKGKHETFVYLGISPLDFAPDHPELMRVGELVNVIGIEMVAAAEARLG